MKLVLKIPHCGLFSMYRVGEYVLAEEQGKQIIIKGVRGVVTVGGVSEERAAAAI